MPLYEYQCDDCEEITELERPHLERHDPVKCDHCGSENTQLILSRTSFTLQGVGWAGDGYKGRRQGK